MLKGYHIFLNDSPSVCSFVVERTSTTAYVRILIAEVSVYVSLASKAEFFIPQKLNGAFQERSSNRAVL
jgi:hypothetical protein